MKEKFAYRFKRMIAIVCVLSLVVGIFPLEAFADSVQTGGTNQYTELTLTDLGITDDTYSSSKGGTGDTTKTLDGIAIEGIYTFSGGMSNSGVHFGTTKSTYRGLYMWMEKGKIVFKYRTNVEGTGTFFEVAEVTLANAGVEETFLGKPVKIRITFDFANVSGTTGDVTFGITVNDSYTTAKTLTGVSTEHLKKTMWLNPTSPHSITVKSTVKQQEPIVYTELTLTDLGITDDTYSSSKGGTGDTTKTLDGVAIEGTYTFSGGMSNSGVHFGTTKSTYRGLYMWMEKGKIVFKYRTNVEGTGTFFEVAEVTLANAGVEETFLGKPVKIRITFDFANVSGTTADVTFGITVNDSYTTTKTLTGVSTEHLKKTMWLNPTSPHSITVKSTVKQQEPIVYTELTLTDLGITDDTYSSSKGGTGDTTKTLDGVAIEGTYTFSGGMSNSGVHFGTTKSTYRGLYMWMEKGKIVFKYRTNVEGTGTFFEVAEVTLANAGVEETFLGKPVKIRITFDFANVSGTTADVTFGITVNDSYTTTKTLTGVSTEHLKKTMWLNPTSPHSITVKSTVKQQEPIVYTEVTPNSLGIANGSYTTPQGGTGDTTKTLDGVAIEGTYTFSGGMSNSGVHFGAEEGVYRGLYMWMEKGKIVFKYRTNVEGTGTFFEVAEVTLKNAGVEETFFGKPVKIRITFDFANVSGTTADVTFGITVNDTYTTAKTLTGVSTEHLKKTMWLNPTGSHSITVESAGVQPEQPEQPEEPDTTVYTELKLEDLGIADGTLAGKSFQTPKSTKTLENVAITGVYNATGVNNIYFGGNYEGLFLTFLENGNLRVRYMDVDKTPYSLGEIKPSDAGRDTFQGEDVKIRASFAFSEKTADEKFATVRFGVQIDNDHTFYYTRENVALETMERLVLIASSKNSTISFRSRDQKDGEIDDSMYELFTMVDFPTYEPGTTDKNRAWSLPNTSLENVAFEGNINLAKDFSGKSVGFAIGKGYGGIRVITNGTNQDAVHVYYGDDERAQLLGTIKPEDVGLEAIRGENIHYRISFTFTETTDATTRLRVAISLNNSKKIYYTVKDAKLTYLQKSLFLLSNGATIVHSSVPKEVVLDPIIFEEFGFTKNWFQELGLHIKKILKL